MTTAVWLPKDIESTNLFQFKSYVEGKTGETFSDYADLHRWSVEHMDAFWQALSEYCQVPFITPAKRILNDYSHMLDARWFEGATLNFAQALLSREDDHPALITWLESGRESTLTYADLKQQVAQCVEGLRQAGVKKGDRVAGILPNTAYPIIAMLAAASLGAIWSSCSPDFGTSAIVDRFSQIEPTVLFVCDSYLYNGKRFNAYAKAQQVISQLPSLNRVVVCPLLHDDLTFESDFTVNWDDFLQPTDALTFEPLPFDHPLYILFSSGTTGKPKCIVHGVGGTLLQHLKELALHTDITPQDNMLFFTTCGWMMWNWMVSTLALGATLVLYDGSPTYPEPTTLFKIIDAEDVTILGCGAKLIATVANEGVVPKEHANLQRLRTILSTGSPLLPKHYDFIHDAIGPDIQISSISGGTDIVSCFALGNPMKPVYRGELQCIGLGLAVEIYDEHGNSVLEQKGELVCTKPFPAMPVCFWDDPDKSRYKKAYFERFPNIWTHGDLAEITAHGGLIIYGRSDTTLNPGGVRIGTAEIYRQVELIPEVIDSVVIPQCWDDDVRLVLFVQLRDGITLDEHLIDTIRKTIRANASPRHVPAKILQVPDIPKTINGKVVEIAVKHIVHGDPIDNLDSIANPACLEHFKNRAELK